METMRLRPLTPSVLKPVIAYKTLPSKINAQDVPYEVVDDRSNSVSPGLTNSKFIEANTVEVTLKHLVEDTIVTVFSKDNEVTISHPCFIETVHKAASRFFNGEVISAPSIRVSHVVKGRVPDAIHKSVNQLLDEDKTIYYERMAFMIDIPSIYEDLDGNRLTLTIGGVRAYNLENLYSKKSPEKFKVFIGFKNQVCTNLCVSTDGFKAEIRVMSLQELDKAITKLLEQYQPAQQLHMLSGLKDTHITERQFAQLIGKTKLYHCLPAEKKKHLPSLDFTDTHINMVAKSFYQDDNFRFSEQSNDISLWKVYNLFTSANKNSYIDHYLERSVNATDLIHGISSALYGDTKYSWFVD